jgi:hypothetical protein
MADKNFDRGMVRSVETISSPAFPGPPFAFITLMLAGDNEGTGVLATTSTALEKLGVAPEPPS